MSEFHAYVSLDVHKGSISVAIAEEGRMQQRQRLDPRHHLGRRGQRMALGDRRMARMVLSIVPPIGLCARVCVCSPCRG
jgi:hypothetical protein